MSRELSDTPRRAREASSLLQIIHVPVSRIDSPHPCRSELVSRSFRYAPKSSRAFPIRPEELASKLAPTDYSCARQPERQAHAQSDNVLVLTEADAVAEGVMDFQNLPPALLNNLRASVAVALALEFVMQQLDIVHRHK